MVIYMKTNLKMVWKGILYCMYGDKYVGDYKIVKKEGKGKIYYKNGDIIWRWL